MKLFQQLPEVQKYLAPADFVKDYFDDLVENLVLFHHKPNNSDYVEMAKIIQKADHHSSKERIDSDGKNDVLLTPLTSIALLERFALSCAAACSLSCCSSFSN